MPRLHRADPAAPGISRRRRGSGFSYEDPRGRTIADEATLERIRALAVPPAWTDVWICADPEGHLQAAGTDTAGRRQYLYHQTWRERQDSRKFRRIERFAKSLPSMRVDVERDLAPDDVSRRRVMAGAVRLLDRATFRIGTEAYAERHGSFGLATIRKSHVSIEGSTITFDYSAKGGVRRVQRVVDPKLVPLLEQLKRRRSGGIELLAYREAGAWRDVRSGDINAYLKELIGEEHSAKDFRTWHATVLAALDLDARGEAGSAAARKRAMSETVRTVAAHLGNTPAVCRASYIDPRVFDRFREGSTLGVSLTAMPEDDDDARATIEEAVLDLLDGASPRAIAA